MNLILKGMILGFERIGAKFIKLDEENIYFTLENDSFDEEKMERAKFAFKDMFSLNVKIIN